MNRKGSEQAGTAGTVLVVEDDEAIAQVLQIALAREGFEVRIAPDCERARAELVDRDNDLVLLDLKLPDGDGLELLAWISERGVTGEVIVMTAFRQEEKALRAYDLGAVDFICKPFKPRELMTRARHVLAVRARRERTTPSGVRR